MIDPTIGASLISGGSSIIGGLLNKSSADEASRLQREMFQKSLDFQKYQYENQKGYNSAPAQAARLRAAGINPLIGEGTTAGTISSVSSPSPANQTPVDYSGVLSAAADIGNSLTQARAQDSQARLNDSQQALNFEKAISEFWYRQPTIEQMRKQSRLLGFQGDMSQILTNLQRETFASQVMSANYTAQMQELQMEQVQLQNEYKAITNGFLPTQLWADISNVMADTKYKLEHNKIDWAQAMAAMKSATAQLKSASKVYGTFLSDGDLKKWNDAQFNYLLQQTDESVSNELKNWLTPSYQIAGSHDTNGEQKDAAIKIYNKKYGKMK